MASCGTGVEGVPYDEEELGSDEEAEGLDLDNMTYEVSMLLTYTVIVVHCVNTVILGTCQWSPAGRRMSTYDKLPLDSSLGLSGIMRRNGYVCSGSKLMLPLRNVPQASYLMQTVAYVAMCVAPITVRRACHIWSLVYIEPRPTILSPLCKVSRPRTAGWSRRDETEFSQIVHLGGTRLAGHALLLGGFADSGHAFC